MKQILTTVLRAMMIVFGVGFWAYLLFGLVPTLIPAASTVLSLTGFALLALCVITPVVILWYAVMRRLVPGN